MVVIFQGQKPFPVVKNCRSSGTAKQHSATQAWPFLSPRDHNNAASNRPKFSLRRKWPREPWPLPQTGGEVDEGFMSAQQTIDELVRMMRARALRYKILAEGLYDRRTAAEVSAYADELEAEAKRLADSRWPLAAARLGVLCH